MQDYSDCTQEEFNAVLLAILDNMKASDLLTIPGIYEILAEEFNNEVLDQWKWEVIEKSTPTK